MKLFTYLFSCVLILSACSGSGSGPDQKPLKAWHIEPDKGDSIFYYKNFDWYRFRGIETLNLQDDRPLPFVKLIYDKDTLIMNVRYLNNRDRVIHFSKLQGKWAKKDYDFIDGDSLFSYLVHVDTAMLELEFRGDPLNTQNGQEASLRKIRLEYPDGDTIREIICTNFFKEKLPGMPDIHQIDMRYYQAKCNEIFYSKEYVKGDSIYQAYITYTDNGNGEKSAAKDWVHSQQKLYFHSLFFTNFAREQDWESHRSLGDRIINMLESYRNPEN